MSDLLGSQGVVLHVTLSIELCSFFSRMCSVRVHSVSPKDLLSLHCHCVTPRLSVYKRRD